MAMVDPFFPLRDWQASLYRGDPAVIDRFLDAIDATLSPGWIRDHESERTRLRPDRIRCYQDPLSCFIVLDFDAHPTSDEE
jgi:hypothetical protein